MPLWAHLLGAAFGIAAFGVSTWAMSINKFTKTHVAIQEDEDHTVVTDGPYAYIRHPMYSAGILMWFGIPLVLGSFWAMIPGGLAALTLLVRTILEDRMLTNDLPGYGEYTRQVRHRLIPGIW
jgi:protein-S-isoprenylcysteine O-methyltransferase Ste14